MVTLTLPYPPLSGNHQYGWRAGRMFTLPAISTYRRAVYVVCIVKRACRTLGPVSVTLALYPPDKRMRDADNALKVILDALKRAGVIEDDSNRCVAKLCMEWHEPEPGGRVLVTVEEYRA